MIEGLIHVYGEHGSGKTFFSLTAPVSDYKKVAFFDGDTRKTKPLADKLGIKHYYNLVEGGKSKNDLDFHRYVLSLIDKLPNDLDLIVFDNMTRFFGGGHTHVVNKFSEFKKNPRGNAAIIGAYEWQAVRDVHFPTVYNTLLEKAKLVIIVTHEKEASLNGVKTGAMVADADKSLRKAASLVIRLTRNETGGDVPTGLIIKNIGDIDPVTRKAVRILPPRIAECSWDSIMGYIEAPVGNRELLPHEQPNEFELSLISGSLTPEQKRVYAFNQKMALMKIDDEVKDAVLDLVANLPSKPIGLLAIDITNELKETYPSIDIQKVMAILSEGK